MTSLGHRSLEVRTPGRSLREITSLIQGAVAEMLGAKGADSGLATVFIHHTSASLLITENADPDVLGDLERFLARLVPDADPLFRHTAEGPDDMPSHVRSALTQTSLTVPVRNGRCDLGTWQGVFLWEHRASPHARRLTVSLISEDA